MFEHKREKLQGRDLRMRHQLRIGPIKRLFDTLWSYRQANVGVEPVKARQPMHTGGIERATEVKEHGINALHVHLRSPRGSATRCLHWCDWRGKIGNGFGGRTYTRDQCQAGLQGFEGFAQSVRD